MTGTHNRHGAMADILLNWSPSRHTAVSNLVSYPYPWFVLCINIAVVSSCLFCWNGGRGEKVVYNIARSDVPAIHQSLILCGLKAIRTFGRSGAQWKRIIICGYFFFPVSLLLLLIFVFIFPRDWWKRKWTPYPSHRDHDKLLPVRSVRAAVQTAIANVRLSWGGVTWGQSSQRHLTDRRGRPPDGLVTRTSGPRDFRSQKQNKTKKYPPFYRHLVFDCGQFVLYIPR